MSDDASDPKWTNGHRIEQVDAAEAVGRRLDQALVRIEDSIHGLSVRVDRLADMIANAFPDISIRLTALEKAERERQQKITPIRASRKRK